MTEPGHLKLYLLVCVWEHTYVWEVSGDSQVKTASRVLLYIVQYFINSVHSLEIWSDIMLCVCVTHFAKGRKKVCVDRKAHSVIGAWGSVPVKTKTCLQVWSMYVPEFCSWSLWLRLAVCSQYLFLCNYRLAMLKGALHAGRRSALGFTREFVWCYSPFSFIFSPF